MRSEGRAAMPRAPGTAHNAAMSNTRRIRLALIGSGWIVPAHLAALDRLDRTELVGVASPTITHAEAIAGPRGIPAFTDPAALLDATRPDVALVAVPPAAAVTICGALVARQIPFLVEKPLAAEDDEGPARLADAIDAAGLVVGVGYHLRSIEALAPVRDLLARHRVRLVTGRWLDGTPGPAWWRRVATGGGQVVEQATHLYDLARALVGEAVVVGAAAAEPGGGPVPSQAGRPEGASGPGAVDVVDATAAVLRFDSGAIGSFGCTRTLTTATVEVELATDGPLVTIRRLDGDSGRWEVVIADGASRTLLPPGRDPYEVQAEAFLDAVAAGDPSRVRCTYRDALGTYRLTRAVVAATGRPG